MCIRRLNIEGDCNIPTVLIANMRQLQFVVSQPVCEVKNKLGTYPYYKTISINILTYRK